MGMAASQARYLGLTARKINVEYEGQQVNQQRTALANESAGLFRQLMGLTVPTAPTKYDYYESEYVYTDPINGKTAISDIKKNEDTDPVTYSVKATYNENIRQYNSYANNSYYLEQDGNDIKIYIGENHTGPFKLSAKQTMNETEAYALNTATGASEIVNEEGDEYYRFTHSNGAVYYINATKNPEFNIDALKTTQHADFFTEIETTHDVTFDINDARLSTSANGLYNSISWTDEDGNTRTFQLTQSQKYNEDSYNEAMDQYNYDKQVYDQKVAEINAKTKKLQETDRTLELRLKQLDTEQEALQTEMEAVKKVIDKNIENVFKTFQS